MLEGYQVQEIIQMITKKGLRKYKFKNSNIRPIAQENEGTKGAVFGFRSKLNMVDSRGIVLTSEEALWENEDCLTHWTPNVYSYGTYSDAGKTIVKGHNENNLKQINTFVIDFDRAPGERLDCQMILDAAVDIDLIPTLILETAKGFQAYFILDKPWFISSKNDYQSIYIAKIVSENMRKAFAEHLPAAVDHTCNHFGIFRIPRTDNIQYFYPALTRDMQQLIHWSMKYEPARRKRPVLSVMPTPKRQVDEKWVDMIVSNPDILGAKNIAGRNTAIFTLSLAYYSSGIELDACFDDMDRFNSNLKVPLRNREVLKIVKSAYRGKYHGATKKFVRILLANWGIESFSEEEIFTQAQGVKYKFKKDRSERQKSHVKEWKVDILEYLDRESFRYRPEIQLTKSELQTAVKYKGKSIPKRSLDRALRELQTEGKIYVQVKAGRGGGLIVATRKALIRTVIVVNQQVKEAYKDTIRTFFEEAAILTKMFDKLETEKNRELSMEQLNLWDTG
ncbi:primase C-terminal domain-containing protein [Enterococcus sp. BWR-S5]|uniref:primase C-terminal domain-containing protein n=1 Tax=Enterococcus sp. BWR-S5 TaxID=2787714 RepID=UPI001922E303|nr:primase C-terminal domain-containing protein [Enterococcus sp. BWR-S5]MBL1227049.1 primase C-terminal domain-containing protein [Enterococcus sp. BWR-S5]